jgi:hypothetical protein
MQGGIEPTGKGAARRPDAASRADTKREDSCRGSQAATTRWRLWFLHPVLKPGATAASRLHHRTSELRSISS